MQKSFMEVQFPVSKVSKESYKERKANLGQTLTGLGKWWGRKPLILVRATILGLLLPATDNPAKDREIFLKILGMDDTGLWARKYKSIAVKTLYDHAISQERLRYFTSSDKPAWKPGLTKDDKDSLQRTVFMRMGYDEKITYCKRPEEMENIPTESWADINSHLGTTARTLQELMQQLSEQRYGKVITVGDCFAGGGSIPFEAARIGLKAYGSDLNPVASLLTWASLNINGASDEEVKKLRDFQERVYNEVDKQITEWGIEHNEHGDRANSYLYCNETKCPACGWLVPMAPSWVIGRGSKTIATLAEDVANKRFDIRIASGVSSEQIKHADATGTVSKNGLECPHCHTATPISSIRRDRKTGEGMNDLRQWEKTDFIPRPDDVFQERLYCIKYERARSGARGERYYTAPTAEDLRREAKVVELLGERFSDWQDKGYIPSDTIEGGYNTDQPIRERGWRYWHQLFNPRQLLVKGLYVENIDKSSESNLETVNGLLGINKLTNWNSKLSIWIADGANEKGSQTFSNQALNTLYNYCCRAMSATGTSWYFNINNSEIKAESSVGLDDARMLNADAMYWITDPPYADAVNYHELSEFFLAWDKKLIEKTFPEWYAHSNRAHAVKGTGSSFAHAMIDVYRNLSDHMPDDGMQVVMFTHQDPAVWAELSLILWAAKLQVTAAWNISTETESGGLKTGNYVKGTVLMVLRKNLSTNKGWLDDAYPQIKLEVKNQIDSMRDLDNASDPDFTDNDYMLAAYAASLKVLTSYSELGDVNIEYELSRARKKGDKSKITEVIESAVRVAYEYLVPRGISKNLWRDMSAHEKFYIKALDFERSGDTSVGSQIELARSFGVSDYALLQASGKANHARVKTPVEFTNKLVGLSHPFSTSLTRHVLMAVYLAVKNEDSNAGRNWLKNELPNYWQVRDKIGELLGFITSLSSVADTDHWQESVQYAGYVKSLVENDGV